MLTFLSEDTVAPVKQIMQIIFQVTGRRNSLYSSSSFSSMREWFRKRSVRKVFTSMKFSKRRDEKLSDPFVIDDDDPDILHIPRVSDTTEDHPYFISRKVTSNKEKHSPGDSEEVCYEAHSPDENALIHAAKAYGFTLVERTPHHVTVKLPNDVLMKFEVLDVLPFDYTRRRMSIIVRQPDTNEIIMYTKGADSAIMERLRDVFSGKNLYERPIFVFYQTE